MRRISIDTLGFMPKGGSAFRMAKRRTPWYFSRPRLLTTFLLFGLLWLWLNYGGHEISIPDDSYAYLADESLRDILNATLGFQKILVLNLPYRTDRRDAMTLAAASSNMQLEFVNGVTGDSIKESAYPPPEENIKLQAGIRGSWRTHMNALQRVVEQNLTTALIFEDDVDWDIRVRQNLQRFALASRFLSENKEVLSSSPNYKVEYRKNSETPYTSFHILNNKNITDHLLTLPLSSVYNAPTSFSRHRVNEHASPYGNPEEWDVLWIGHCGTGFPRYESPHKKAEATVANVVLRHDNDATVPKGKYLKAHPFQDTLDPLASAYPEHTRIFHRATGGTLCTVGYAVSQRGARRLLHQFGVKAWNGILDAELGRWCADEDPQSQYPSSAVTPPKDQIPIGGAKYTRKGMDRVCLTSQPPIFAHHHPKKGQSDIGGLGGGYAKKYETKYLRYSVRMNLERLMQKATPSELEDQWPDEPKLQP